MADKDAGGGRGLGDIIVFIGILALLGLFWLFTGGPDRLTSQTGPFLRPPAPLSSGDTYSLSAAEPWRRLNTTTFGIRSGDSQANPSSVSKTKSQYRQQLLIEEDLADIQKKIDSLSDDVSFQATFGPPSPYRGKVTFQTESIRGAKSTSNKTEYLAIKASSRNAAPIPITGWKVVSAIPQRDGSVSAAYIGNASKLPVVGEVNPVYGVQLEPGGEAFLVTGASPFGVSFKVNICSGYLGQFQEYTPPLTRSCPKPLSELQFAKQTIPYLNACEEYVRKLPACKATFASTPKEYGTECDQFVKNELTYNGCIDNHSARPLFYKNEWRIFLNETYELWRNKRDIIKLLDTEGKTVDMILY